MRLTSGLSLEATQSTVQCIAEKANKIDVYAFAPFARFPISTTEPSYTFHMSWDLGHSDSNEAFDVERIASEMYDYLCAQDGRTVELADYSSVLRDDYDLRSGQIDTVIQYGITARQVLVWREPQTGEMWITAIVPDEAPDWASDDDGVNGVDDESESEQSTTSWP